MSATITLENSQASDYVPSSFYNEFNKFAQIYCEKSICAIHDEDAYRLIDSFDGIFYALNKTNSINDLFIGK